MSEGRFEFFPREKFADFQPPAKTIAPSIGHWNEWIEACKGGQPTRSNFDFAGRTGISSAVGKQAKAAAVFK